MSRMRLLLSAVPVVVLLTVLGFITPEVAALILIGLAFSLSVWRRLTGSIGGLLALAAFMLFALQAAGPDRAALSAVMGPLASLTVLLLAFWMLLGFLRR